MRRPVLAFRTLRGRVAGWVAVTMVATMAAFGVVSYWLLTAEEVREETSEPADEVAADIRERILATMGLVAPFAVVVVTGGAYIFVRRVMRPLDDMVREASQMTLRRLHRRFELPTTDDEVRVLVETLNSLFARL